MGKTSENGKPHVPSRDEQALAHRAIVESLDDLPGHPVRDVLDEEKSLIENDPEDSVMLIQGEDISSAVNGAKKGRVRPSLPDPKSGSHSRGKKFL